MRSLAVIVWLCSFGNAQIDQRVCPRPRIGDDVVDPQSLSGSNGSLKLDLSFRTLVDVYGLTLYCYISSDNLQAPTVRLHPGDELVLRLKNELRVNVAGPPLHSHSGSCGGGAMSPSATNLHFHGLNLPPTCHQDETLKTLVQPSGPAFEYRIKIPKDAPPGLYWYHPHPHGFTEPQVLGGASGALIVEGIERDKPKVGGLPERVLVLRDQPVPGMNESDEDAGPGKDISLNFVPIMFPLYKPARMRVKPSEREFWRVLNAAADTYFDLQVRFGPSIQDVHQPQSLELIAVDGVPIGGDARRDHIFLPPGARAEFIVTTPPVGTFAQLVTLKYDTGPDGASVPYRAIANLLSAMDAPPAKSTMPSAPAAGEPRRFDELSSLTPVRERKFYFSEVQGDPKNPKGTTKYFITAEGATPKTFDMNFKQPDITVQRGTVEDWIIENRAQEAHTFHIHQLHFQVLEPDEAMLRDTVDIPYWDGKSSTYPRVKLRMDFRNPDIVGTFVYHCHILEHEDGGMMGSVRVR